MTRATGMRWYVILGVVVAVALTGFLWILLGPGQCRPPVGCVDAPDRFGFAEALR
jgi:hypothetical protein